MAPFILRIVCMATSLLLVVTGAIRLANGYLLPGAVTLVIGIIILCYTLED